MLAMTAARAGSKFCRQGALAKAGTERLERRNGQDFTDPVASDFQITQ
jgi:hypothetical protein